MNVIDVMIPVWRPDMRLRWCVGQLLRQTEEVRTITLVCSVDPGWNIKELEQWAEGLPKVLVEKIDKRDYNHGGVRHQWAAGRDADILLFLVQDAVPADAYLVGRLAQSLQDPKNAVAYARQIPSFGCDEIEKFTRYFNYPEESERKTQRGGRRGIKDCFTSNVCAAYRRDWYERVGGFERQILLSEDSVFAAKAMAAGGAAIYCAKAKVLHAHRYGCGTLWKRHFDIGVVHGEYKDVFRKYQAREEGVRLVYKTAEYLIRKRRPALLPKLFSQSIVKFLAYQCGIHHDNLPQKIVEQWSLDKDYWRRKRDG